jgi:hypothetical protein
MKLSTNKSTPIELFESIIEKDIHNLFYDDASQHLKYLIHGTDYKTLQACKTHLKNILNVLENLQKIKDNRPIITSECCKYSPLITNLQTRKTTHQ